MKRFVVFCSILSALVSCAEYVNEYPESPSGTDPDNVGLSDIARLISSLPIGEEQLDEVYDAVSSSSSNGYDEEYMMSDLFSSPGKGVGDSETKASKYKTPMKDLIEEYLMNKATKGGAEDVERYINSIIESGAQIYWPFSENWDGSSYPIVTFDPGYGAESNYGYEIRMGSGGVTVVDSVFVDEELAKRRPVWVINKNDDSAFTPYDMYLTKASAQNETKATQKEAEKRLFLQNLTLLRNYDSWFGGASEILVKCGSASGFKASTDDELKLYYPALTDFMIVVKRKDVGKTIPFEALLVSDFTSQIDKIAFLMVEDDGGTTTSWKCSATVRYQSKSYGFDIEIPYKDKDDIIWRGQLSSAFFSGGEVYGRFGDAVVKFRLE